MKKQLWKRYLTLILTGVSLLTLFSAEPALAASRKSSDDKKYCTQTASAALEACKNEILDDKFISLAKCTNIAKNNKREACLKAAEREQKQHSVLCKKQQTERLKLCTAVGEARYTLDLKPEQFETDFANLANPNPYFPLKIGNQWVYKGGDEINTIEVANKTKLIEGIRCIVYKDQVTLAGHLHEDTDDWYCQAKSGDVYYLGEEVKNYETFVGDSPQDAELVHVNGSFKHGRDGDKGGIISLAKPRVGDVYREEFSLGNAEDSAEVLSVTYSYGQNAALDKFVPQALVQALCSNNCVVTKNISQLEPGSVGIKYYAQGIGFFLEIKPDSGEILQLVSCNFDARCSGLPTP